MNKDQKFASKEDLTFKIVKISVKGIVTIRFNKTVFVFDELNDQTIDVVDETSGYVEFPMHINVDFSCQNINMKPNNNDLRCSNR